MGAEGENKGWVTEKIIKPNPFKDSNNRKRKGKKNAFRDDPPSKRRKANSGHEAVAPKTPSGSARSRSPISSPSSSNPKNCEDLKEAAGRRSTKRKLDYEDASERQSTVSITELLKQLSEIIDTVEGSYPDYLTGTVNLRDLFSAPSAYKSEDARKRAGRGVMLLKEGLSILTEAEHLSTLVVDSKAEE